MRVSVTEVTGSDLENYRLIALSLENSDVGVAICQISHLKGKRRFVVVVRPDVFAKIESVNGWILYLGLTLRKLFIDFDENIEAFIPLELPTHPALSELKSYTDLITKHYMFRVTIVGSLPNYIALAKLMEDDLNSLQ